MSILFARYVQDKRRRRPLLYASLLIAGILESGGLAYFLIAALLHVSEISPPPLYVMLLRPPVALPPPQLLPRPPVANSPTRPSILRPGSRLRQPRLNPQPTPPSAAPNDLEPG